MFQSEQATMKCPRFEPAQANKMEKTSSKMAAAQPRVLHLKASPVKEPIPIKPLCPPRGVAKVLLSLNNNTREVHNKENSSSREHDRTLDEGFEDSGYLSLHNSQIEDHPKNEEDGHVQDKLATAQLLSSTHREEEISPNTSPSKCKGRISFNRPLSLVAASTPVARPTRRTVVSTPSDDHRDAILPIVDFQKAVCQKLAKNYQKSKRYDWSIVAEVAEHYHLDRVIGGQMGQEYVDMFASLLSRNMKIILTKVLTLLGDMDLISCKKVSKTWRKIICEDTMAQKRCDQAEEESGRSLRQRSCGLTRDVAVSRVVLSCMQPMASSSCSPSSPLSSKIGQTAPSPKESAPKSRCTHFEEFLQASSSLKQHESLRSCKRCGSPATYSAEIQRATCKRLNCGFDFCTNCQEAFHGSAPCRTVQPRSQFHTSRTPSIIPGSARSKRNIRRL
ncbi:F-box only protein 5 isoform X2 [Echeneis naucrates]|uniref:F-box only protein 5 isoform X2 n=1 Tax=Echeneis naucrates TaxID=173247 RepID=UPI0011137493|nr:F-box only protein 5 isoform X2 [Echeneis naucrates]